jgi:hypothetical protein
MTPTITVNLIFRKASNIQKAINRTVKIIKERKKCSNRFNLFPKKKTLQPKPIQLKRKYTAKLSLSKTRIEKTNKTKKYKTL